MAKNTYQLKSAIEKAYLKMFKTLDADSFCVKEN